MKQISLNVPAKINLFLHITGRRADGYHLLESIFCPVDWYDQLSITTSEAAGVSRSGGLAGLAPEDDLVVKAANSLLKKSAINTGLHIDLKKNIPSGAGLGGGSADAAYTLMAINELLQLNQKKDELIAIGATLGADVPFFMGNGGAFVSGIGEIVEPLALPELPIVIVKPPASIATVDIFTHPDLTREASSVKMLVFGFSQTSELLNFVETEAENQLQPVAELVCKQVVDAVSLLKRLPFEIAPEWVRMSGSGSSVFGVFSSKQKALQAESALKQQCEVSSLNQWLVKAVTTLPKTPLKSQAVQ
ncbi:MAG: 4-(cytidine 5'-diphospho)-2-C-methyl-D-erythritol kinase [Burkholderiales bacterium]|nr:4-(cytidine 5'-diphospho)-2-C-methyl-D-erythritol kinase [Burkholderiales bacterium]